MSSDAAPTKYRRRHRWPILVVVLLLMGIGTAVWAQALKPPPAEAAGCNQPVDVPTSSTSAGATGPATSSSSSPGGSTSSPGSRSTTPATGGSGSAPTTASKSGQSFRAPSTSGGSAAARTGTASGSTSSRPTSPASPASSAKTTAKSTAASTTTSTPTSLGTFTDPNLLADIRPADPTQIPLRVLNASTVVGQAKTVTDELRAAGFASILPQDNDPLYPADSYPQAALRCYGEIRFGQAGTAEARTVLMVAPCAQLVVDDRIDNSVDLALGSKYTFTPLTDEVKAQLVEIKNASVPPAVIEGQTQAPKPLPPIPDLPSRAGCPD